MDEIDVEFVAGSSQGRQSGGFGEFPGGVDRQHPDDIARAELLEVDPATEQKETEAKAAAMFQAVRLAESLEEKS